MSRFDDRLKQDLGHIADRATPSPDAWEAIQTRIAEHAEQPEMEITMLDTNPNLPRRVRPSTWILSAAAAVLLVVVGGIFALRGNDENSSAVFAGDSTETPDAISGGDSELDPQLEAG